MFIARQPIFNKNLDVFGYELLFRSDSKSKTFDGNSSVHATASVLGGLFESGITDIIGTKHAFINFDSDFLMSDLPELIEPHRLIIEVLEDVIPDESLILRVIDLKTKGYKIALDDFVNSYDDYPLVPYADIIKFDLMVTPLETIEAEVAKALRESKILLAEKIEVEDVFLKAKEMGFHLFQGYFFAKPAIATKAMKKSTTKALYGRIINELKKDEPSFQTLAEIIETDVSLAYKVMKIIKSRAGDDLVYSIKRALTYMGLKELERWINILMLQELGEHKPKELMELSLIRTKFSEQVALMSGLNRYKYEASLMGLFSIIDAVLDQEMSFALQDISLPNSIKESLIYHKGTLINIYLLMIAYEKADWMTAKILSERLNIEESKLYDAYLSAVRWSNDTMTTVFGY